MITINLKPGAKRSKGTSPLAGATAKLKGLGQKIKDPIRLGAIAAGLAIAGFVTYAQLSASNQVTSLEPKLEQARAENQRFRSFLSQKRRLESVRDSINAQILTIQRVDGDRYVWPHVLDEVTRAVPPYTWLVDVGAVVSTATAAATKDTTQKQFIPPVEVRITGRTMDIQGYTKLLRQLEDSPYLRDVTAVSANTVVEQNRAVTAFVLKATFSKPAVTSQGAALTAPSGTETVAAQRPSGR